MATIQIFLDDDLTAQAEEFGLLEGVVIKSLFTEEIQRRRLDRLLSIADKLAAAGDEPMSQEEVQEEIRAYRKAHRAARA
jgi:uncharacterized protein YaaR (DUF327 family)